MAIREYAIELAKLTEEQIQEVLQEILNTTSVPTELLIVVLDYNARLMTALRDQKAWPPVRNSNELS